MKHSVILLLLTLLKYTYSNLLLYPFGGVFQFNYGFSTPLKIDQRTMSISAVFQANYDFPKTLSALEIKTIAVRKFQESYDISKEAFYAYFVEYFDTLGFDGKSCLLRTICEISRFPMSTEKEENLLEKIVEYIFTPNDNTYDNITSPIENLVNEKLILAKNNGQENKICSNIYSGCLISIVDLFTAKYII